MTRSHAPRRFARLRVLAALSVVLIAAGCSPGPIVGNGPESTFTQNGYQVTCRWTRTAISGGGGTPTVGPESESFCRSRAREAVGTLLIGVPGAQIQTVTIEADGSATVCYGSKAQPTCDQVLPAMPRA